MVAMLVLCRLNVGRSNAHAGSERARVIEPGALYLTAASRHLYERNQAAALEVLHSDAWRPVTGPVSRNLWISERTLLKTLDAIRNGEEAAKWWTKKPSPARPATIPRSGGPGQPAPPANS